MWIVASGYAYLWICRDVDGRGRLLLGCVPVGMRTGAGARLWAGGDVDGTDR